MAAVLVAEAAVLLLRPREGVITPAPVQAEAYFSAAQLERARAFRAPQRVLGLAGLAVEVGLLVWLVRRPPRVLGRRFRHPLVAAALAGAALSVAVDAAGLPLRGVARARAKEVGLVTQGWPGWAWDVARGWAIGAVFAGSGAAVAVALIRRSPRGWWLPGSVAVVAFGAATLTVGPVVLDPVFNRFEPVPPGALRADVLRLAERAGVQVGEVYRMDASRRTTAANAYVAGLGATKRVVLYDTLLEGFTPEQVRFVVAHELAHVRHRDLQHGLLFLALVTPAALFAGSRLTARLAPPAPAGWAGPAVLPALALSVVALSTTVTVVSNQLSRRVEARADSFALRLTRAPEPFIAFERRIAVRNVSEPSPPAWSHALFGTHPTTLQRIGIGEAFAAGGQAAPEAEPARRRGVAGRRTRGGS
ncbi:MAG: M48 family metallopeptidase [Actinomycetota bacterium]|nr:M48 family metallopeptidase [Actinomycetota bacterium]